MTSTESSPEELHDPQTDKIDGRVLAIAGVVVLGAIMSILDITVVSVAQQVFQKEFDANAAQAAWTMTGYTLALAAVIPLTGWAADRFGTKRLYLAAILFFTLGSLLCAFATSLPMLVTFRVIQGLGGGMLMPLGMTIMTHAAGPERIGRLMAVLGVPMLLGPICGPILGGWLIDAASWHWVFLINIPIGAAAMVYAYLVLPKDHVEPSETFDFVGMLLLSPGLALFLYGVSSIPETGSFFATKVMVFSTVGLLMIVAFIPWALNKSNRHPLIDLRLFQNKEMTIAVVAMSIFCIAFFGAGLLFPQYYQFVRGEDSLHAGLLLAPQGLGAMVMMPIAGVYADKRGPGKIVLFGITLIIVGMALYATLDEATSYWFLSGALFIMGMGMGCTMMPIFTAALATLREHAIARGSTLLNIMQQVAASIGTAIFTVLLTNGFKAHDTIAASTALSESLGNPDDLQAALADPKNSEIIGQVLAQFGFPDVSFLAQVPADMADAFSHTFMVATIMVAFVLIPAWFLPRHKLEHANAVPMGH